MSNVDYRTMLRTLIANSLAGQRGRVVSDKDLEFQKRMKPSNKPGMAYGGDVKKMMDGGPMEYADGGEMEEYNMGGQIIPFI